MSSAEPSSKYEGKTLSRSKRIILCFSIIIILIVCIVLCHRNSAKPSNSNASKTKTAEQANYTENSTTKENPKVHVNNGQEEKSKQSAGKDKKKRAEALSINPAKEESHDE